MTMFDSQGIPEHLLDDGRRRVQFEDAVAPLTSFSLIRIERATRGAVVRDAQLSQLAARKWLELNQQVEK
jgi:hypothetical protein